MSPRRPDVTEYPDYYGKYIALVPETAIMDYLDQQNMETASFFKSIDSHLLDFRYAPGKWCIREILSHCSDTERIFAYRALCISRDPGTPLQGYDQDRYVSSSSASAREMTGLIEEFSTLRTANLTMFKAFTDEQWMHQGQVNGYDLTVRSIPFIIAGHLRHHMDFITKKYRHR